jgi:hypothetical protein
MRHDANEQILHYLSDSIIFYESIERYRFPLLIERYADEIYLFLFDMLSLISIHHCFTIRYHRTDSQS